MNLKRRATGKLGRRELSTGQIRGVVYGHGIESVPLVGDYQTVTKVLDEAGTSHIIKLKIDDGEAMDVLVKDLDHEPISNQLRHFDLLALKKGEKINVEVPVILTGESPAVKLGHIVHQLIDSLEIQTTPDKIPESFAVNVANLNEVGDTIYVRDLDLDEDFEIDEGWLEQPIVKIDEVRELEVEDTTAEVSADEIPSERGVDEAEPGDGDVEAEGDKSAEADGSSDENKT